MFADGGKPGLCKAGFFSCSAYRLRKRHGGFTLVELIVTMILISILAAVALPRWRGGTGFEERALRDKTLAALRYAQKSAVAARRTVCVSFNQSPASATFNISSAYGASDCSAGTSLLGPDGAVLQVSGGSQSYSSAPTSLIFDAAGRPGAAASIGVTGLASTMDITVEAETGYVH